MSLNKYYILILLIRQKFIITRIPSLINFIIVPQFTLINNIWLYTYYSSKLSFNIFRRLIRRNRRFSTRYFFKKKKKKRNLLASKLINYSFFKKKDIYNLFFFFLTISSKQKPTSLIFLDYTYILQLYFYKIFSFFFNLNFINVSKTIKEDFLRKISSTLTRITPKQLKFYYFTELSETILSGLLTKNLYFLYKWIKYNIEKRALKSFYKFKFYLFTLLDKVFWPLRVQLNLKGFFIKFKGKFLKGGGRKKKSILSRGKYSGNSKNLRLIYKRFYLRTISGIIGCTLKVSY